jgi:hypothetical protein
MERRKNNGRKDGFNFLMEEDDYRSTAYSKDPK